MTSYLNVKNKHGLTKLATLIKEAGFNDVKVTVKSKSITLTPSHGVDLSAGLADLKKGNYKAFKSFDEGIKFLESRSKKTRKSVTPKR
jgi:hypothetical protein